MTILAFIFWVVVALLASGVVATTKRYTTKNKVHFYVARDKDEKLWLYLGKPIRVDKNKCWMPRLGGFTISPGRLFENIGLNKDDYKDLKWEDEPVEVFLNMEKL